ncbi:N-acetyl-gamma-glutamyl-phosphate reductase [Anabaena sp. FACHB-709]|uniref:N-acetyl-gamma-glutamyl-phosphate reductase 2 n=3 Tax=Nostocaceae TaxID=1162 RepID=ARGC2_NOSS1|nr:MULTISPECIES: N-acetyl-gamma-glutamyl-phosphate reductase [Nostocaceae]P54894.1 RecName: Full=N-acetyl-gamma-glutamyl-phosphate reductase 2; Short=AGPR 2; AltName: Full=N-acetyl-glutamate semialdehyde dehydrogenase 2; Short=NAGSA dehydrogenase 2 [Nostoc sp. PCC 7120 = FACHB-418]BAY68120.1 N-acetyl-gamma-glutamyl-phosphate reductase [Trichormus variabilis NIES-23]HBW29864.1 N-acetyl-gamma-glutamyl-phosphate reductase 2 [Nostoc sp. UBA8866]MBD2169792.1 N-acetyl-gamma-glutamyl-phosphate reducta
MNKPKIFIDGEAGTTGLQIYSRLNERDDIELVSIAASKRKDADERAKLLNSVDVAILCLPDDAAREAVSLVNSSQVKILDASTAYRTAQGWVYGFPEMNPGQREKIANAQFVSNPGCYPTGFLACVRPLIAQGILPSSFPITINAVSGYSGGGKSLIQKYDSFHEQQKGATSDYPFGIYGLQFGHKHVKEMHQHSGLASPPLFIPAVGDFEQGMLVQIPLPLWTLDNPPSGEEIHQAIAQYYQGEKFVQVAPFKDPSLLRDGTFLDATAVNGTNIVQVFVFGNDNTKEALLVARLDNLGKGASGAAVQNLNIMLGLPEELGL